MLYNWFVHAQKSNEIKNTIVKFNLFTPINIFSFPTIQLGFEQKIKGKNSLQTEMGIMPYSFYEKTDTQFVKPSGYKLNVEFRHYFHFSRKHRHFYKNENLDGFYMAANVFYEQNKFNKSISFYDSSSYYWLSHHNDNYTVYKQRTGIIIIFGLQVSLKKIGVFDFYIGGGGMYRNIKNTNMEYNHHIHYTITPKDGPILPVIASSSEETKFTGIFKGGIRLGIRL